LAAVTCAGIACRSLLAARTKPQRSGSMWSITRPLPIV
jgi:hypothetical protein